MHRKTIAGLAVLVSAAACGPRHPVATAPAPDSAPVVAPPAPPIEEITRIEAAAPTGTAGSIGADLLGTAQYDLPVPVNLSVRNELEFLVYQRHDVVGGWLRNAARYYDWVRDVFASYGVPRDLAHLGMIESGYRPTVRSHAGAVGMWQFMPATGRGMGLRIDSLVDERMDPVRSTHAAARHLRDLHRRFRGDWSLAAAAYNAGEGRINRGLGRYGATDFWDLANRGDLAQETRRYVPRLYATTIIAKDPVRFGYPAPGLVRRFAFDSVRVDLATPLGVLAELGNLPVNELVELNPHLFRQVAPRNYWVWVPFGQGGALQQAFAASEFRQRGGYGTYRVREGDSLARLAELSGLTAEQIRSMNLSVGTDALRPGTTLRLYADAARVLNARPEPRLARTEPSRDRPRVLGDTPANAAGTSGSGASSDRRSGSAESPPRSSSSASGSSSRASGERASSSSSASSSAERRSGSGTTGSSSSQRGTSAAGQTHTVADGETLWGIARRYGVTVDAVRQANEMESETIRPGQTLRIPRASSSATSSSARTDTASRPGTSSSRAPGERSTSTAGSSSSGSAGGRSGSAARREHTVGDGETLWGIARRYGTTVDSLRRANNLDEDQHIRPGQKLTIPDN